MSKSRKLSTTFYSFHAKNSKHKTLYTNLQVGCTETCLFVCESEWHYRVYDRLLQFIQVLHNLAVFMSSAAVPQLYSTRFSRQNIFC